MKIPRIRNRMRVAIERPRAGRPDPWLGTPPAQPADGAAAFHFFVQLRKHGRSSCRGWLRRGRQAEEREYLGLADVASQPPFRKM